MRTLTTPHYTASEVHPTVWEVTNTASGEVAERLYFVHEDEVRKRLNVMEMKYNAAAQKQMRLF